MRLSYDPRSGDLSPLADELPAVAPTREATGKVFAPPAMSWHDVLLRPLRASDQEYVQTAETTGELAARWRFHGATPGPQQWMEQTFSGTLAQYLVFTNPAAPPIGFVTAYEANFAHGHAKLAAARLAEDARSPAMVVAISLLIRHVFACWNLRKLYMDVPEYNLPQFDSLISRYFQEEGRLIDHVYFGEQYWDQITLALYRAAWPEIQSRILPDA
jgi:RimJ/RimL family protein N-acetyltransferase